MYYPWQTLQWQQLMYARQAERLPHALLLTGAAGLGKAVFADSFVRAMLCEKGRELNAYCNACHACRLIAGRTHPNVFWLEPEKAGAAIKVDQIRAVSEFVAQSSLQGEYRFVIINPADHMNIHAANALLKTLEEPAEGAILILISGEARRLPATIISRCQRIVFARPDHQLALSWLSKQQNIDNPELLLRLCQGAPLAALHREDAMKDRETVYQALLSHGKQDPLKAAAACTSLEPLVFLDFVSSWIMDLLRLQVGIEATELTNPDYVKQLQELTTQTQPDTNSKLLAYLQLMRTQLCAGINLNKQLLMEGIFIRWARA